jgi:hypothetical protein
MEAGSVMCIKEREREREREREWEREGEGHHSILNRTQPQAQHCM